MDIKDLKLPKVVSINGKEKSVGRVEVKKQTKHYSGFKDRLNVITDEAEKFIKHKIEVEKITPSPSTLKAHLQNFITPKKETQKEKSFFDFLDQFIDERQTGKDRAKGGKIVSSGIVKRYRVIKNHLQGYEQYANAKLSFDKMKVAFHESFIEYLFDQKELSKNTVGSITSVLKTFLAWAFKKGYSTNRDYEFFERYTSVVS